MGSIAIAPVYGTRPQVGFKPTDPFQHDGIRMDPPWSPPIAMSTSLDITYKVENNVILYINLINLIVKSKTGIKFATHLATLRLKTQDFIRPLIGHVINGGEDLWSPHPMSATAGSKDPFFCF